jgi:hypothetical protein
VAIEGRTFQNKPTGGSVSSLFSNNFKTVSPCQFTRKRGNFVLFVDFVAVLYISPFLISHHHSSSHIHATNANSISQLFLLILERKMGRKCGRMNYPAVVPPFPNLDSRLKTDSPKPYSAVQNQVAKLSLTR